MAAVPQWFTSEVLRHLPDAIPGKTPGQYYARCPVPGHPDRHRSFAIAPGESIPVVFCCHGGCPDAEARDALIAVGVPEDYLGPYGTPAYEIRRRARPAGISRQQLEDLEKQIERLRWEMLELKASVRELLDADLTLALLKVRLWAVMEGAEIPVERKSYVDFAVAAGVSAPAAYKAWRVDPLVLSRKRGNSGNHVVLAHSEDESQAEHVSESVGIIDSITHLPADYRPDSPMEPNDYRVDKTDAALAVLRAGGLVPEPRQSQIGTGTKPAA